MNVFQFLQGGMPETALAELFLQHTLSLRVLLNVTLVEIKLCLQWPWMQLVLRGSTVVMCQSPFRRTSPTGEQVTTTTADHPGLETQLSVTS